MRGGDDTVRIHQNVEIDADVRGGGGNDILVGGGGDDRLMGGRGNDLIRAGSAGVVMAGGMESMTNAPYLLPKARAGYRMGHQEVLDHMFFDGLQNPYDGQLMGYFAEQTAQTYKFSREAQDEFAIESVRRALAATEDGAFSAELAPVVVKNRNGEATVDRDEEPFRCDIDRIPTMRPAFAKDGTVTAASSSSIADGAASLLLMTETEAERRDIRPLARVGVRHFRRLACAGPISPRRAAAAPRGCLSRDRSSRSRRTA